MVQVRAALEKAFPPTGAIKRPLLVGADSGVGPRSLGITPANISNDTYIAEHLAWVDTFTSICGGIIDAVSWHTYVENPNIRKDPTYTHLFL